VREWAFYGPDYARTLRRWDGCVLAAQTQILAQGFDTRFLRLWRPYLAYCEAGFRSGRVDLMHVVREHARA
jgi:cyclopropane-fatty-acyl-phospholipid synthase